METFPCTHCHKAVTLPQQLKPGDQFMVSCPHCNYCNSGGMGFQAQQGFGNNQKIGQSQLGGVSDEQKPYRGI